MDARYLDQVRLLLRYLPALSIVDCFALKGGTAINLRCGFPPALESDELETHYRHMLEELGKHLGRLGTIFRKAIQDSNVCVTMLPC